MKRKLALLLTMTLLAGSLDSGMLVSAADFSADDSIEQAVEEEPQSAEESRDEELTDAEEELSFDEAEISETSDDSGEDEAEITEPGVDEKNTSSELEEEPEQEEEAEPESLTEDFESVDDLETEEASLEDGSEDAESAGADNTEFTWNGLSCVSNEKGEVTIKDVINDDHYDQNNNKVKSDRCAYVDGNIPSSINGQPVVRIDTGAFSDCINLTSLNIPDSVKEIGRGAFSGCTSLSSIHIPDNGVVVEAGAFRQCTSLTSIHIPASMVTHDYVGESPAYPGIFAEDAALTTITFGEGITKIAKGLFLQCSGLRKIVVPDTVKNIEAYAFRSCSALTEVTLPEGLENIYNGAFSYSKLLTSMKLPSTLKFLDVGAFSGCTGLTTINIPAKMKTHDTTAANRQWPGPFNGCTNLKNVTLDNGMEEVPRGLFYAPDGIGLEEIVIPDSVKWIDYSAFYGCTNLKKVTLSQKLEGIDSEAFQNCKNMKLSERELPKTLKNIGDNAFADCTSLENVTLPDSTEYLGISVFYNCQGLTEVNIPAGVNTSGATGNYYDMGGPFADCVNLKKVTFGKGIKEIPQGLFYRCTGIESIEIPSTVTTVSDMAFARCANLQKVTINSGLKLLEKQAFYKCEKLENLTLPSSVEEIRDYVFEDCKSLKWVTIPASVKTMAWYNDITYLDEEEIFVNVSSDFAIKGFTGSFAEAYAKKFSIPFVSMGSITKTSFKITFNKNAKNAKLSSKDKTKTVKKGSTYGKLPTPTRTNYYFLGWYTKASGGSKVTASKVFRGTGNQTLYAHWAKADLSKATVTVSKSSVTWNGKAQTPGVTVKFYGNTLKNNTHYTVSYSSNKEPGKATVTVKGKGLFGKTKKTARFTINKATRTLNVSNVIKAKANKGKTFAITVKTNGNSGVDKPKPTFKSGNTSVATVKGNKVTLNKTGYSEVTVTVPATKHYKATSKKILAVLQGTQSITLNCVGLKKDKAADTYIAANDILAKSLGVKTLDGAQAVCTVSSVPGTAEALMGQGDKLTAKGNGTIKIKIQTKTSKHYVYPPISKMITVKLNGFPIYGKTWGYSQNSNGTVTLTKYYGNGGAVKVPSSLKINNASKKVTALGNGLFRNKTTITTVTLPDSLTKIGANAFEGCTKLTTLEIPDAVTSIGAAAFSGCTALKMIRIPDGLTSISNDMMKNCRSMNGELYLPSKVTSIGTGAFQGCTGITKVHVFGYLKKVAQNAFAGCSSISSAAYAGTKSGWAKISWAAGNEVLKNLNTIQYYIYGPSDTYGDVGMTDGEFISQHPDSLQNMGISKITNELEDETYTALSSVSTLQIWVSAFKSQLDAGKPDYKAMMENLTGVTYSEDQLNKTIALEMLQNMSGEEWNTPGKNEEALISTIHGFFGENKSVRDEFLKDGNKRWAFSRDLAKNTLLGKAIGASEMNECLKKINDNWSKIENVYSTVGKSIDAYEFVVSWLMIMQTNYDQILQLMQLVPQDSGLFTGLTILERWYSRNLSEIAVDYMTEASLKALAKVSEKLVGTVVDEIWKGHRLTASSYTFIAGVGFRCIGSIIDVPTINDYNKAWLSVCNTKVLKLRMEQLRWQLANGQNDESTRSNFILTCKAYFASLRQQIKYASNTLPKDKSRDLNFRFSKYEPGLNYTSYIKATIAQYLEQ